MRNKTIYLLIVLSVFAFATVSISQTVVFSYDETGNRKSREITNLRSNFIKSTSEELIDGALIYNEESSIVISPNPTHGEFTISMYGFSLSSKTEMSLYNSIGVLVWKEEYFKLHKVVDMDDCEDGLYFLNIINGETREIWKIIKE